MPNWYFSPLTSFTVPTKGSLRNIPIRPLISRIHSPSFPGVWFANLYSKLQVTSLISNRTQHTTSGDF